MQKQISEEATQMRATFEDLCPDWSENIAQAGGFTSLDREEYYDGRSLEVGHYCIVGEAHE